jgi:tetratricopeptide (TPR) repeat protein
MRPYKPLEKGRSAEVNGMFLRSLMGNTIEVGADEEDEQTRQLVLHKEALWLTNVSDPPLPLWLDEGLAEVFSTFSIDDTNYTCGKPLPWHVQMLSREKMIPLKQLVRIRRGSLLYNEGERTSIFYAESWAFVHYLLFSGHWEERSKYNELVRALPGDSDPDALFKRVFGSDCAGMDERLKAYLAHGSYTETRLGYDRTAVQKGFTARPASPSEVKLAQACLLCAVGRPGEALPRLRRIASAMPQSPDGWEAEGFAAYATHDYDEAATSFGKAAERGSRNTFVSSFLGDTALGIAPDALVPQATVGGDLRLADNYYERELSLNPLEQHGYDNLSSNFFAPDTLTPADAWILGQGSRLFPDDALIRVGLAVVALKQAAGSRVSGPCGQWRRTPRVPE